jgi:hypothetical protein
MFKNDNNVTGKLTNRTTVRMGWLFILQAIISTWYIKNGNKMLRMIKYIHKEFDCEYSPWLTHPHS